ncbi:MAG: PfaD family polyunsaturated fatty acid/polyketide biosynthesis protein [Proteobacteria bacterium]|nr:PfaD family polyunsaturated fatty acid/polyketide biosynthesis protein [Pseudomonadota bacterium]MCP4921131.1 PfaD family polyunsaturated fatty acid/polyketide biosynthesis protein [Pseudomonadota bacterium]
MSSVGAWTQGPTPPSFAASELLDCVQRIREPIHIVQHPDGRVGVARAGRAIPNEMVNGTPTLPLLATLPALYPEWLGDRGFCEAHGVRFPYVQGAMANGIATTRMVIAMCNAGMLGFFGAAGLPLHRIEAAVDELVSTLGDKPNWGCNLIHAPQEPDLEQATVDLYLSRGVRRISAAAYMKLNPMVVQYAATGLREVNGQIVRKNFVFAKISRPEVAGHFMRPAPADILDKLVQQGRLTADEARLASQIPVAEDYTVESDSGGHTDNRPLGSLFPRIVELRDQVVREQGYSRPIRLGAAGGLGTPTSVASAFALGAAYVLTGSVNQGCVESGLSPAGREMLTHADIADVGMAPAADMFELGVEVQVLKRGTMFGNRGKRLYDAYHAYASLDAIPANERTRLEKQVLGATFDEVWANTASFWKDRDPRELDKANRDPKHKMALCFRWYLGLSSRWAIAGEPSRRLDYQIWCGPAMGAFNAWAKGSFLEPVEGRTCVQVALNLLEGAAVLTRAQQLRVYGVAVPAAAFAFRPRPLS